MARRVGRLAVALPEPLAGVVAPRAGADPDRSPGPGVAYPYRSRPLTAEEVGASETTLPTVCFLPIAAWVVDLALRAAGFIPVPLSVRAGESPGSDALATEAAWRGAVALALPGAYNGATAGQARSRRRPAGPGDSSRWLDDRQLDAATWRIRSLAETTAAVDPAQPSAAVSPLSAARRLIDLAGEGPSGRGRAQYSRARHSEIAVAGRGPADAGDRLLVAWSLLTGGALVLEANPEARVATAAWSRPTLFLGDSGEVSRLRQEAQEWEERWRGGLVRRAWRRFGSLLGVANTRPGPPFGRLHTLVLRGGGVPEPGDESDFWSSRGVRQVDLASLVQ